MPSCASPAGSPPPRELSEVTYQFDRPFVLDSSAATRTFGLEPTPVDEALRAMLDARTPALATSP